MSGLDPDRVREALDAWTIDPAVEGDGLIHVQRVAIAAAARAWLEPDTEAATDEFRRCVAEDERMSDIPERIVAAALHQETE